MTEGGRHLTSQETCILYMHMANALVSLCHHPLPSLPPSLPHPLWARTWLWSARKDTGDSMASPDLAHNLTTFNPILCIFSLSWSTAVLLGAQTKNLVPGGGGGRESGKRREVRVFILCTRQMLYQLSHLLRVTSHLTSMFSWVWLSFRALS